MTSEGKPVHGDNDNETIEGNNSTLALLPNGSEEDEIFLTVRHGMRTVIIGHVIQTELLNHRNDWVVYHISTPKKTFNIFTGLTRRSTQTEFFDD